MTGEGGIGEPFLTQVVHGTGLPRPDSVKGDLIHTLFILMIFQ